MKTTSDAAMDAGILKHPDENQLYQYATETYNIHVLCVYHFTPARAAQAPRLSISVSIWIVYVYPPRPDTLPNTEVLGGRRTTIMMMTRVNIDIYVFTLS